MKYFAMIGVMCRVVKGWVRHAKQLLSQCMGCFRSENGVFGGDPANGCKKLRGENAMAIHPAVLAQPPIHFVID